VSGAGTAAGTAAAEKEEVWAPVELDETAAHRWDPVAGLAGDDEPIPIIQRPTALAMQAATDSRRFLTLYARMGRELFERVGPLLPVILAQGAADDREMRAFTETIETNAASARKASPPNSTNDSACGPGSASPTPPTSCGPAPPGTHPPAGPPPRRLPDTDSALAARQSPSP
jgi:hypothetical protein